MKALEILNSLKQDHEYNIEDTEFVDAAIYELETIIEKNSCYQAIIGINNERIIDLEEALKPKTCEGCKHRSHLDESLTNKTTNGFCVENGFFTRHGFCCNQHEPKDNA